VSDDPDEAANVLLNLAGDPALWQRCSKTARALVEERFSSDRCHRKWLELLQTMATESNGPNY
jgi:glycosyltransferase involved in cell wall biosynthesis